MAAPAAVFLEVFGTVVADPGTLATLARLKFKAGAATAIKRFVDAGARIFLSTHRGGVPAPAHLQRVRTRITDELAQHGVVASELHFLDSPSRPGGTVWLLSRRALEAAAAAWHLDLRRCVIISEHMHDVKIGRDAGMITVLICSLDDTPDFEHQDWCEPDYDVETLHEAADKILYRRRHE